MSVWQLPPASSTSRTTQDLAATALNRPELGVRSLGVTRYSYTIYYRIGSTSVEIVHVRDDRRAPLKAGDL